jgi:hypothetical protein
MAPFLKPQTACLQQPHATETNRIQWGRTWQSGWDVGSLFGSYTLGTRFHERRLVMEGGR